VKGPIPDLSKPSPFGVLLRQKRAESIAEGNALMAAEKAGWMHHPSFPNGMLNPEKTTFYLFDSVEFAEIQRQVQ